MNLKRPILKQIWSMKALNLNKEYKTSGATLALPLMFYCLVMDGAESRYRLGGLPDSEKSSPENKD